MTTTTTNGNGTHRVNGDELFETRPQQQKPKRREGRVTIPVTLDGYRLEFEINASIDDLPRLVARLKEIGAEPAGNAPQTLCTKSGAPTLPTGVSKPRVTDFDADGSPICPVHGVTMRESTNYSGSWYCSKKAGDGEPANSKGYCSCSFKERQ